MKANKGLQLSMDSVKLKANLEKLTEMELPELEEGGDEVLDVKIRENVKQLLRGEGFSFYYLHCMPCIISIGDPM